MKKILFISRTAPYKNVPHAGGKIEYHYLKKLMKEYDITLITGLIDKKFRNDFETGKLNIKTYCYYLPEKGIHSFYELYSKLKWKFQRKFLYKQKYFELQNVMQIDYVNNILLKLYKNNYVPDEIILDWTDSLFYVKKLKKYFPNVRITLTEQDVTYLSLYRKAQLNNNRKSQKLYLKEKKWELNSINKIDYVNVLNEKDKNLLIKDGISKEKIKVIVPYYDTYFDFSYKYTKNNIIFYGAMNRVENQDAVIWFIDNVFNKLPEQFHFTIIGGNPPQKIQNLQSDRITVTGFVVDLKEYFENCLCMVVPLLCGAGIKIKILEGMSAGIPILTNEIGIEGIPAINNQDYIFCNNTNDYIENINKLAANKNFAYTISYNAKQFIKEKFNYDNYSYI